MRRITLFIAAALFVLSGCAIREHGQEVEKELDRTEDKVEEKLKKANKVDTVTVKDEAWLTRPDKRVPYKQQLPDQFSEEVSLKSPTPIPKNKTRELLRSMSGYDVRFAVSQPNGENDPLFKPQTYHFKGPFEELLDVVANQTNTNWKFDEGSIIFSRRTTKTFRLAALPGSTSMSSSFSTSSDQGGQGGGQSSGGGEDGPQSETQLDAGNIQVWQSIEKSIKSMLSEQGKVTPTPGLGTITVTDHPTVVKRVGQFIQYQNKKLKQRVTIHYKLLSLQKTDASNSGIEWKAILENISDKYQLSFNDALGATSSGLNLSLMEGEDAGDLSNGSRALVEAFKSSSNATIVTDGSVTTLNNQPVPVQVLRNTQFVNERPVEASGETATRGTSSTTIRTGFSMSVLPRVLRDRSMLLQFTLDLSKLEDIQEFGGVQTPQTRSRSFMQRTRIESGQTMILTGFEQVENSQEGQGSWLSGFTSDSSQLEQRIVLMMTPVMTE